MVPLSFELIVQERQQQLLRESEEDRLVRLARPVSKRPPLAKRFAVVVGAWMVSVGSKMMAYGTIPTAKLHRPEALPVLCYGYRSVAPSVRRHARGTKLNPRSEALSNSIVVWSRQ